VLPSGVIIIIIIITAATTGFQHLCLAVFARWRHQSVAIYNGRNCAPGAKSAVIRFYASYLGVKLLQLAEHLNVIATNNNAISNIFSPFI